MKRSLILSKLVESINSPKVCKEVTDTKSNPKGVLAKGTPQLLLFSSKLSRLERLGSKQGKTYELQK